MKKEQAQAALAAAYMDTRASSTRTIRSSSTPAPKLVLVDTGTGEVAFTASKGKTGRLSPTWRRRASTRRSFDAVIVPHYHGDHINGLIKADNTVAFPNAEVLVPAVEHNFWMSDADDGGKCSPGRLEGNFKNVRRVFNEDVLRARARLRVGQGRDPGHEGGRTRRATRSGVPRSSSQSGNGKLFVQVRPDARPVPVRAQSGMACVHDQDPVMAEATRRKTLDMLAAEKMMVQGFHFLFPRTPTSRRTARTIAR